MSKEKNNEIDLLLRRMGRRENGIARTAATSGDDRHLDADELSSYAQNALPAAARARYTAHLAECATCRRLVTELSVSLGAATARVEAVPEPSGLKKFLAGLLSPLVLRYAVPALGLVVVVLVGFVVLRQQRHQDFVAQLQEGRAPLPTGASSSQSTASEGSIENQKKEGDKVATSNAQPDETRRKTGVAADAASEAASGAAPVTIGKDDRSTAEPKPSARTTPAAAPAKAVDTAEEPAAKTEAVAKQQQEQAKEKNADKVAQGAAPAATTTRGFYTVEPAGRTAQNAPKPESSTSAGTGARTGSLARVRPGAAKSAEDEKRDEVTRAENQYVDNETKTIAGRRFRKQGSVWTDTAYASSTATVNMARNSEQFRALVADEPAIGTIARQLEGEVIVVWKGRAYHIR